VLQGFQEPRQGPEPVGELPDPEPIIAPRGPAPGLLEAMAAECLSSPAKILAEVPRDPPRDLGETASPCPSETVGCRAAQIAQYFAPWPQRLQSHPHIPPGSDHSREPVTHLPASR
jgi:hypothetical protein